MMTTSRRNDGLESDTETDSKYRYRYRRKMIKRTKKEKYYIFNTQWLTLSQSEIKSETIITL